MRAKARSESRVAAGVERKSSPQSVLSQRFRRLLAAGLLCTAWSGAVVWRLWDLQVRQSESYASRAQRQHQGRIAIRATRGAIFDRNGVELALSTPVQSIGVFPQKVNDPDWTASILAEVIDIPQRKIAEKLKADRFQWLQRLADPGLSERLKELNLTALHFEEESRRYYPKAKLAAHVLGFVDIDHNGLAGLESRYQAELQGSDGSKLVQFDALRNRYEASIDQAPVPGSALYLTLDEGIQALAEERLEAAIENTGSRAGAVVVMDPENGDVLALANWPTFDPNQRPRAGQELNYAISSRYEPGSTFKLVTVAAALEEGLTHPSEQIDCQNGAIYVGRRRIRDHKPYGVLSVSEVLANSSNVGVIKLGLRLGASSLRRYVTEVFRFGELTGIELPGEVAGVVHPVGEWRSGSVASVSMGHEITVTPLQMAQAMSVVANGGLLVRPRLVDAILDPSGRKRKLSRPDKTRVMSAETAARLRAMLERTVREGTGVLAQTPGYRVGGKTGTAQMVDAATGGYSHDDYMASFAGFAPVNDPSLVALIVLEAPRGHYYGGQVAAPVFGELAAKALRYRDVPPELPLPGPAVAAAVPDVELLADLAEMGDHQEPVIPRAKRDGAVLVAGPAPDNAESPAAGRSVNIRYTTLTAPDLRGRTLRQALAQAGPLGLRLEAIGSGVVVHQSPAPGTPLELGGILHIELGRLLASAVGAR